MKIALFFIIFCSSTICSADLFDMELTELCNLVNGHKLSEMKITSVSESGAVACSFDDKISAYDKNKYLRSFRVLRSKREPRLADSLFVKFEGLTQKINDPNIRSEYLAILDSLLNGVSSNQNVIDNFLQAVDNIEPNSVVAVNLDAMSIKAGYRVYATGLAFYRLDIRNKCKFSLSDTANRSKCLKKRTSMPPAIVSIDSK